MQEFASPAFREALARMAKAEEAKQFLQDSGVSVGEYPFEPLKEVVKDGWGIEINEDRLILQEESRGEFSRRVEFIVDRVNGQGVKAVASRPETDSSNYEVDNVFNVRSEGNFLFTVWGPQKEGSIGFEQKLGISRDGGIRFQVDEHLGDRISNLVV